MKLTVSCIILRLGYVCSSAMLFIFFAACFHLKYIATLDQFILAKKLICTMPEYVILCMTIGFCGAVLTEIYGRKIKTDDQ